MRSIALIAIFMTAFAITANMHIYVQSLRLSIYAWHIFLPVIPIHLFFAITIGNILNPDRATKLYYTWSILFLLLVATSIVLVNSGGPAMSNATRLATNFGIGMSFLAVAQNRNLAIAGALGIAAATLLAAGVSFREFLDPDFTMIVDQRYQHDKIKEGIISRVGGLHINPNSNARFMTFGMFVSCFFIPQKYRLLFCLFIGAAVFTTVSRSGMLTWAIAMVMLAMLGQLAPGKVVMKLIFFVGIGLLGLLLATGQVPKLLIATGLDELMSEHMIERVSTGFFSQGDGSTNTRQHLIYEALELYADHPVLGAGMAQSNNLGDIGLGSHNMILQIVAELGTVGLLVYLSLFLIPISLKSPKATCFLILYTISSLFAHGLLAKPVFAFILPAGVVLLCKLDTAQRQQSHSYKTRSKSRSHRRTSRQAAAGA